MEYTMDMADEDRRRPMLRPVDVEKVCTDPLPVDERWRRACWARMGEMGINQHQLAEWIGSTQGSVSQAISLRSSQERSTLAHPISMALGLELPMIARLEILTERAVRENPELLRHLLGALEAAFPPGEDDDGSDS